MPIKVYTSGNYIVVDNGTTMSEYAKGYTTYTYLQSTQTFTIKETVGGEYKITRTQILAGDITDEPGTTAFTFNSFVTFLRENTGFKTASGGSGASYKVYTALLTQSGTNAPVATVLENTLGGNIVWSYNSAGNYTGTLAGAFVADKTIIFTNQIYATAGDIIYAYTGAPDEVYVETINSSGTNVNNVLAPASVEIRVYN